MPVPNADAAYRLARESLSVLGSSAGYDFEILNDETIETDKGSVFFYNSQEFIRTGDPISALAGNGPILVTRDGIVRHLSSAVSWEIAIRNI
jgi:chromosome condensin MukBEF complex kleisin-like MukF subunit